jgi:hypothetical protein
MKKTLGYPELWRKKQRELPVKGNPDTEWLQIRAMLDNRMPVTNVADKPYRFKLPKWGLKVLLGVTTAAAVYMGGRLYLSKTQHEAAKPNELQMRRDSLPSPAKVVTPPANTAPAIPSTLPSATRQTKLIQDTSQNGRGRIADSVNKPAMLSTPVRRDSALTPVDAAPLKPLRDSIGPMELKTKDIRKDTSNNNGKAPKKKRRPKVSVFF